MSAYPSSEPQGAGAVAGQFTAIWQAINALRGSNGLLSAVIGSGGITVRDGGSIDISDGGSLVTRYPSGRAGAFFGPQFPADDPSGYAGHGLLIQRDAEDELTAFDIFRALQLPDGDMVVYVGGVEPVDSFEVRADLIYMAGPSQWVTSGEFGLYELPTTSSGANLHLGTVGGVWTVAYVTSSERYKQDIADADIDPDAVLTWRPRTWRDKADVEAVGEDAAEHIGFIAEEVHAATPEFVNLDDEGRPDSLKYDRMVAGLVALAQKQAEQIADLTSRLEALEAT